MNITRPCPDCLGRGEGAARGVGCERCEGSGSVPDLGTCSSSADGIDAEGNSIYCERKADREIDGRKYCDHHALRQAVFNRKPCPSCGGDSSKGLHRGMLIGSGLVKTCPANAAMGELQSLSNAAAGAEPEEDGDLGESCLTDSERNPSMGGRP